MQWRATDVNCSGVNQLIITQDQGDNTPTVIIFPYDITDVTFSGTVQFSSPIELSIGAGIEIQNIVSCTGAIANTTLTISAITSGTIYLGMPVNGVGILSGTSIIGFVTGTGGTGTYLINQGQTAASTNIAASKITMQLTSEQTQDVPEGQYPFDLWTISPVFPPINTDPLTGFYVINPAITRIS